MGSKWKEVVLTTPTAPTGAAPLCLAAADAPEAEAAPERGGAPGAASGATHHAMRRSAAAALGSYSEL